MVRDCREGGQLVLGGEMKVSIVISVYNSHEALRRQLLHFERMNLPSDVEIIIVDDGSNPRLTAITDEYCWDCNLRVLETGNNLAWTDALGRNLGASKATGEFLLMTDIDHILTYEAIEAVRDFGGDRMGFPRYYGVLTEEGELTQNIATLKEYGMPDNPRKNLYCSVHGNTFAMRRATFNRIGGYPKRAVRGYYGGRRKTPSVYMNANWGHYAVTIGVRQVLGPPIYMFPIGRFHRDGDDNPGGLFHDLSREKRKPHEKHSHN